VKKREFITLLGGAAVMWPQKVMSEGHNRPPVIAWLWFGSPGGIGRRGPSILRAHELDDHLHLHRLGLCLSGGHPDACPVLTRVAFAIAPIQLP
jgi:hypothetical protein